MGFSFALMRLFHDANLAVVAIEYFIAGLLRDFTFNNFLLIGYEIVVLALYYFSLEYLKTKRKTLMQLIFILISKALKLYFSLFNLMLIVVLLIECAIDILALLYFKLLYKTYRKKFIFSKFSRFEYLLFSMLLMLSMLGLFSFDIAGQFLILPVSIFLIIFTCRIMPADKYLLCSVVVLLCLGLVLNDLLFILFSIILAIFCISFMFINKYLFYCSIEILLIVGLYCSGNLFALNIIMTIIPGIICVCLPNKIYIKLSGFFAEKKDDFVCRSIEKDKLVEIRNKLNSMSETFFSMKENFKMLIVGKINRKTAAQELAIDVIKKTCENCPNLKFCLSSCLDRKSLIAENISYAIEKGKLFNDELGGGIKTYCIKPNILVNEINSITGLFLAFEKSVKVEDESKLLISSELENFAKIFKNFAKNTTIMPINNKKLSFLIKEALLDKMIEVYEVAVFESETGIESIQIVADNELVMKAEFVRAINLIIKSKVAIEKIEHLEYSGVSLVTFRPTSEVGCRFAYSTSAKETVNGDNISIVKLDNEKYFVAIADGMGHGKTAGRISKMVLELVKSMFVAGLELELVIESINKLLLPVGLDNFSTLDACVIDLKSMTCSFIKLGSSVSILKHKVVSESIVCKSLPIGIVQNIRPTIINKRIFEGDTIFLASDGVVDVFGDPERYKCFINDAKISNLQKFTDDLIDEIKSSGTNHSDDMTIIAVKLLKNNQK